MDSTELRGPDLLAAYGWDDLFAQRFRPFAEQGLIPARVVVEYQHIYRVVGMLPERLAPSDEPENETLATVAGRLRHRAAGRVDYPGVGDWVAIRPNADDDRATIHGVVERKSQFVRKVAGSVVAEQVVAANVDVVLLVMALDEADFNPRRLERYLVLANESGARPVVVLSKADLADNLAAQMAIAQETAGRNTPI